MMMMEVQVVINVMFHSVQAVMLLVSVKVVGQVTDWPVLLNVPVVMLIIVIPVLRLVFVHLVYLAMG